jgi:hypothetical protein
MDKQEEYKKRLDLDRCSYICTHIATIVICLEIALAGAMFPLVWTPEPPNKVFVGICLFVIFYLPVFILISMVWSGYEKTLRNILGNTFGTITISTVLSLGYFWFMSSL